MVAVEPHHGVAFRSWSLNLELASGFQPHQGTSGSESIQTWRSLEVLLLSFATSFISLPLEKYFPTLALIAVYATMAEPEKCGFEGNDDMYGMGTTRQRRHREQWN